MPCESSLLEALTEAAGDTLSTMAMLDLKRVRTETSDRPHEELLEWTTFVALKRDDIQDRMMVISLSRNLSVTIVAAMLGLEESDLEEGSDLVDGVGELGNMVAGVAKALVAETPDQFILTLPVTIEPGAEPPHAFGDGDLAELAHCEVAGEPIQIGLWTLGSPL